MAKQKKSPAGQPSPSARENFRREIEHLLGLVPAEQWDDPGVRGVLYDFLPWHRMSSVTVQTRDDDPKRHRSLEVLRVGELWGAIRSRGVRGVPQRDEQQEIGLPQFVNRGHRGSIEHRIRQVHQSAATDSSTRPA